MNKRGKQIKKPRRSVGRRAKLDSGGEGGGVPKWERVLERRAVNSGWIISQKRRATLISKMYDTIEGESTPRDRIAAARVVVAADSLNVQREKNDEPEHHVHEHTGRIDIRATVIEMQQDPDYVDYLNQRAIETTCIPVVDGIEPE